jgi:hypothetical protein
VFFISLLFGKDKNSKIYNLAKYTVSDFSTNPAEKELLNEIEIIQKLWNLAKDSIAIELNSFNIGYPASYIDVLKNHIIAFNSSEEWQEHIQANGKQLDYAAIKRIMLTGNVYKPLTIFFKKMAIPLQVFDTEKHGFVTKENLLKAGFTGNEIVPMPFMVWITLERINE